MTVCEKNEQPGPGYDAWLREKVGATLRRVESGEADFIEHQDVLPLLAARMAARLVDNGR